MTMCGPDRPASIGGARCFTRWPGATAHLAKQRQALSLAGIFAALQARMAQRLGGTDGDEVLGNDRAGQMWKA
jgi:hypothetical protein